MFDEEIILFSDVNMYCVYKANIKKTKDVNPLRPEMLHIQMYLFFRKGAGLYDCKIFHK